MNSLARHSMIVQTTSHATDFNQINKHSLNWVIAIVSEIFSHNN